MPAALAKQPTRARGGAHTLIAATVLALVCAFLRLDDIRHLAWQPRPAVRHSTVLLQLSGQGQEDLGSRPRIEVPAAPASDLQLEAGMPVHGSLRKRGPLPALVQLVAGRSPAELSYRDAWATQRLAGGTPPFPSKWCAVMFNDKYKLIYLKCPKTAGNTLVCVTRVAGQMTAPASWNLLCQETHNALVVNTPAAQSPILRRATLDCASKSKETRA